MQARNPRMQLWTWAQDMGTGQFSRSAELNLNYTINVCLWICATESVLCLVGLVCLMLRHIRLAG